VFDTLMCAVINPAAACAALALVNGVRALGSGGWRRMPADQGALPAR